MKITSYLITLFIFFFHASIVFAQDNDLSFITIEKKLLGYDYIYANEKLTNRQLKRLLKEVPLTENDVKAAEALFAPVSFFYYLGGSIFGIALAAEVAGPKEGEGPNWGKVLLIGGGLSGLGSFFDARSNDHYKKAVDIYNNEIKRHHKNNQATRLRIILGVNEIGFSLRF